jgi:hypothetical protein
MPDIKRAIMQKAYLFSIDLNLNIYAKIIKINYPPFAAMNDNILFPT